MREIKTGDKYLCKSNEWSNFTNSNIYNVVEIKYKGVFLEDNNKQYFYVHFDDLKTDFTDLQEESKTYTATFKNNFKGFESDKYNYDFVNPEHYKKGNKEVIDMMLDIWGVEKLIAHCEMCAFKYRMRIGEKPSQPIEQDLKKANWYENKAKELKTLNNK